VASHLLGQARLVAERARAVAELEHRSGAIGRDIDAFRELVGAAVAACHRESAALDPSDAARDLVAMLDEAQTNQRSLVEAERQRVAGEARIGEWERKVGQQRDALARWLAANDARDPQDLHTKVAVSEAREGLLRELRECEIRLAEAGGDGPGLERLKAELATSDLDALQAESRGLADSLAVLASERDALLERRGGVERELLDLRNREGTSALLLKRERLRAELQSVVQRWSEVRIARRLIERTRGIYEAERQPQVVKAAEGYFAAMTGGRYTRVIAPLGEQTLRVSDDLHTPKTPDQLSRGTREQLYLALRFGLIDQFAERSGPLPVAVDEVLVNFDPDRALEAARGFARLSRRHQVIAFTCHPWVVELFKAAEPNARIWELSSERAAPAFATPLAR
jgi:uncharacterized protein YhaN